MILVDVVGSRYVTPKLRDTNIRIESHRRSPLIRGLGPSAVRLPRLNLLRFIVSPPPRRSAVLFLSNPISCTVRTACSAPVEPATLPAATVAQLDLGETGLRIERLCERCGSERDTSPATEVTCEVSRRAYVRAHVSRVPSHVRCGAVPRVVPEIRSNRLRLSQGGDAARPDASDMSSESVKTFASLETPGYVGFANLPNQVHRKSVKKGFEFTLMVVGESGLGKSTLVNSLFLTDLYPERIIPDAVEKTNQTVKLDASTVEIEERGVKLRLTVVDTPGYGDAIDNTDSFRAIIQYIDDQFERFLRDESGLNRRNIVDNRIHCCFYFISPFGHGLKPLDIEFMKQLHNKVNIVPVIAKADVLTKKEVLRLKKRVMEEIEGSGIKIYPLPDCDSDEDEDYKEQVRQLKEAVPFAVCGANTLLEVKGKRVRGRLYPWGVVEVENPDHCDFIKLRTMLITHMQDLQEVTQEVHYENYRSERLAKGAPVPPRRQTIVESEKNSNVSEKDRILQEKEAEIRHMQELLAVMQAQMQQQQP